MQGSVWHIAPCKVLKREILRLDGCDFEFSNAISFRVFPKIKASSSCAYGSTNKEEASFIIGQKEWYQTALQIRLSITNLRRDTEVLYRVFLIHNYGSSFNYLVEVKCMNYNKGITLNSLVGVRRRRCYGVFDSLHSSVLKEEFNTRVGRGPE